MKKTANYHHGDLRTDLLKQGRKRLARDGYEALSLRELARDVGVAASAPYAHFKNREDLFNVLILEGTRILAGLFEKAAALVDETPQRRLGAACAAYLGFARRKRELFRLMFASPALPSAVFASDVKRALTQFDTLVGEALGDQDPAAVREAALACWSTMHGFAMLRLHRRLQVSMTEGASVEAIVNAVLRQVQSRA